VKSGAFVPGSIQSAIVFSPQQGEDP
jgi:hypothetical protein